MFSRTLTVPKVPPTQQPQPRSHAQVITATSQTILTEMMRYKAKAPHMPPKGKHDEMTDDEILIQVYRARQFAAASGISKTDFAKYFDMSSGRFSTWLSFKAANMSAITHYMRPRLNHLAAHPQLGRLFGYEFSQLPDSEITWLTNRLLHAHAMAVVVMQSRCPQEGGDQESEIKQSLVQAIAIPLCDYVFAVVRFLILSRDSLRLNQDEIALENGLMKISARFAIRAQAEDGGQRGATEEKLRLSRIAGGIALMVPLACDIVSNPSSPDRLRLTSQIKVLISHVLDAA
eukprot:c17425_g1_i2.p1 GENE.c17425_g1_i2~~c17425_g1_i2.p1  ORF type:complete len:289 (+),score=44.33 c17425_g1_i2:274-1140(+)